MAVSALFLVNGFVVGSWAPVIPEFARRFGLSETALGGMILLFGIGSLLTMPLVGALVGRIGTAPAVRVGAVLSCLALPVIAVAPSVWLAGVAVFLMGGAVGGMDVAMNANAVAVERHLKRAIMSSCHGFWSLGGLTGAIAGGALIARFGTGGHAAFVAVVSGLVLALVWRAIRADAPAADAPRTRARLPLTPIPYIIGIMALFSMVPEGAVLDWGALFLRQERGAGVVESGFAFGAFSATMAVMRFLGDGMRDRFGAVATMRASALIAMAGLLLAGQAPGTVPVILGFALAGIGVANLVPIAFSAAGNLPGLAPGVGITIATMIGYSGLLAAPSLIGAIAEHTGFQLVFTALPALLALSFIAAPLARSADGAD
ncbi:MAG: MFS transporter [Rhodobiaceae bacterium]|nr:MFS transporter [Rhodobiaceae bacterium]